MKIEETKKCKCKRNINMNASYANNNKLYKYVKSNRDYSGKIYTSDFNTETKKESIRSQVADMVSSAIKFDKDCDKLCRNKYM